MCSHRGVGRFGGTDRVALVLYTRTRNNGGNDSHRGGGLKGGTDRVDTHCSKFAKRGGTGAGTHKPVHPYALDFALKAKAWRSQLSHVTIERRCTQGVCGAPQLVHLLLKPDVKQAPQVYTRMPLSYRSDCARSYTTTHTVVASRVI